MFYQYLFDLFHAAPFTFFVLGYGPEAPLPRKHSFQQI